MHKALRQLFDPGVDGYNAVLFLDEAGDDGWRLDRPYHFGGSSRGFVMAGLLVRAGPDGMLWKGVESAFRSASPIFDRSRLKWTRLAPSSRVSILRAIHDVLCEHEDCVHPHVYYVNKQRARSESGYNGFESWMNGYMVWPSLLLKDGDCVLVCADRSSIWTPQAREQFCREMEFAASCAGRSVTVSMKLVEGSLHLGTQVADLMASAAFSYYVTRKCETWKILRGIVPLACVNPAHDGSLYETTPSELCDDLDDATRMCTP